MNDRAAMSGFVAAHGPGSLQAALIQEALDAPRGRDTPYEISPGEHDGLPVGIRERHVEDVR